MLTKEACNEVRINERVSEDFIAPAGGSRARAFISISDKAICTRR